MTPRIVLTLGDARYDVHAAALTAALGLLPRAGTARCLLPAAVDLDAAPGDDAVLVLDSGDEEADVLTGTVRAVRRGLRGVEVMVADAGAALAAFRPATTYEALSLGDVIENLAADAGVTTELRMSRDTRLPHYVAHPARTAAEHVAALAALGGAHAFVDAAGTLVVQDVPEGRPDRALRYGRELLAYEVAEAAPAGAAPTVLGTGPAGSADAPEARVPSFDRLPAGAPAAGADARWLAAPVLRTPEGATTATEAAARRRGAEAERVRAEAFLLPGLRPGALLEVQDVPGASGGPWVVARVRHDVHPQRGARTRFEGVTADVDPGLLAGVLGALGGLL